jgi:hypothetical protein
MNQDRSVEHRLFILHLSSFILCLGVLVLAGVMGGCATPRTVPPMTVLPAEKGRVYDDHAAAREVEEASKMIDAGDTSAVIPILLNVISKYPASEAALDARYWLGIAYYKIGGYRDAIELFKEYLRLAPSGKHTVECAQQMAKVTEEYGQKYLSPRELDDKIKAITDTLDPAADDVKTEMELADLLWKRGDYTKAGNLYKRIVGKHPEYANDPAVTSRVELLPNGEYTVLTPAEVQRRQAEAQPLVIINTASFHSGHDLFTREQRYYAVTGQVVNRSDSVLNGVQVIVTIYGFGNVVYDTTTVNIGRLSPSEIRAFSVRFGNLENIENVNRHECVGTFQR